MNGLLARVARFADSPWFFPTLLAATVVGLFFDAVGPDRIFAYRDSLHFYPQLYQLVREEWLAGRVPLWNPLLNCGQPLVACGTSGAFYLPQLVLTMLLPDGMSLNVYCILHLAFAATGAYLLARYQACSRPAATVAGLAYAFGGSVLFQIYNPIYAAGAAWLVWAVYAGLRLLDGGGIRDLLLLSAALAMSVFAGEPQAAYHAGLVLGLFWLMRPGRTWRSLGHLAAAGMCGGLLCLVQVVLAAEFAGETTRAMDRAPYSLWEVPRFLTRSAAERDGAHWYDIMIGRPPPDSVHYESLYDFSFRPARILELVWPDFSGPTYYRWLSLMRLDDSGAWANSIYMGMVPLLAAAAAGVLITGGSPRVRPWLVVLMLALLTSIGGLGAVGLWRNMAALVQGRFAELGHRAGDEIGGLYWLWSIGLPGYAAFRYPEKWMTVFALAMSQLAGLGLAFAGRPWFARRLFAGGAAVTALVGLGVVGLLVATIAWGPDAVLPGADGDARRTFALRIVTAGGVQAAAMAAVACGIVAQIVKAGWLDRRAGIGLLAVVTAVDLVMAGRREIVVGSYASLVESCRYVEELAAARRPDLAGVSSTLRVAIQSKLPAAVDQRDPPAVVRFTGAMLRSHVPWAHHCGIFGQSSTAMQIDIDILSRPLAADGGAVPPRRAFDISGVEYFLFALDGMRRDRVAKTFADWSPPQRVGEYAGPAPDGPPLPTAEVGLAGDGAAAAPVMVAIRNQAALPRARIVRRVVRVEPVAPGDCRGRERLLRSIAFPSPELPDLFHAAVVELPGAAPLPAGVVSGSTADNAEDASADACRVVHDGPQRVVVEARLERPGLLVLADTFTPDWSAVVSTEGGEPRPAQILRANHIHRGVPLPAGASAVEFRYRSRSFAWSAAVTLAAWGVWAIAAVLSGLRPCRRGRT